MMMMMRSEEIKKSSSNHHHHHVLVKLAFSFLLLLLGLTFRLLVSDSFSLPPPPQPPSPPSISLRDTMNKNTDGDVLPAPSSLGISSNATTDSEDKTCNIFYGDWVPDPSGPAYTNATCRVMEAHQDCSTNGRPDSDYVYWRWNPRDCQLPRFDPGRFLDSMRDKSWAFVGDSISRNHVQSFVGTLSQAEEAVEVYHDEEYRSKRWHFPAHNFSVSVIWTPFLVKADIFEDINGVSYSETQLHLDVLDETWTGQFVSFDFVVIAGGKWFLKKTAIYHENDTATGCQLIPGTIW